MLSFFVCYLVAGLLFLAFLCLWVAEAHETPVDAFWSLVNSMVGQSPNARGFIQRHRWGYDFVGGFVAVVIVLFWPYLVYQNFISNKPLL